MQLLKDLDFKGIKFDIIAEGISNDCWHWFTITMRTENFNDVKKKVKLNARYISVVNGLIDVRTMSPSGMNYDGGRYLQPHSFVDVGIGFEVIKEAHDGDRIELEANDGRIASLLLIRASGQWYILETKEQNTINRDIKKRIEHFESIDEKFGLVLQNFSVQVEDETSLKLFCEVLALNGEVPEEGFKIEVAFYDMDNNIVGHTSLSKYDDEFKGFEVFSFGTIRLPISVDEIGKIRIYPTR